MSETQKINSPTAEVLAEVDTLIRARYPVLYLITHEEERLELLLSETANNQKKPLFTWTATNGLSRSGDITDGNALSQNNPGMVDPTDVLQHIKDYKEHGIFILKDFHPFLEDPHVIRRLRDTSLALKESYKSIIICAPRLNLPLELEKDVTILDIPLPDLGELFELLKEVCVAVSERDKNAVQLSNQDANLLVRAARGLTLTEAENVFSKAVVTGSAITKDDINLVIREKQQIIRKSGILDFFPSEFDMKDIGGLHNLKAWLNMRSRAFSPAASQFGLPSPKGILLLGAPGTGKSMTAKAVSKIWGLPLLRLDFGRIFSGLVGSSEENMRQALKVAEGVSPAVLWIDEIEKAMAGNSSGASDGGTASRVFGTFLTWMQETKSKVFVVATANRIADLPPELTRQGRFDGIFFLDLPHAQAREEIFSIQIKKRKRDPSLYNVKQLAQMTEGFSGAEIEHTIVEALFIAFSQNRELTDQDILQATKSTVPLSVTYAEELKRLRNWCQNRARPADSSPESRVQKAAG